MSHPPSSYGRRLSQGSSGSPVNSGQCDRHRDGAPCRFTATSLRGSQWPPRHTHRASWAFFLRLVFFCFRFHSRPSTAVIWMKPTNKRPSTQDRKIHQSPWLLVAARCLLPLLHIRMDPDRNPPMQALHPYFPANRPPSHLTAPVVACPSPPC